MKIRVLGCGTSSGVPMLGCDCAICTSDDPRNRRRRVSILVEDGDTRLLVDTSPDLREQLLDARVTRLDAVLYTHGHADHVHGLDDLRSVNYHMNAAIPAYGTARTIKSVRERFDYVFSPPDGTWWTRPSLTPTAFDMADGAFSVGGINVRPFSQGHGRSETTGFMFGGVAAYSTDVKTLEPDVLGMLKGIPLWIVDSLGYRDHPTHANLEETMAWVEQVKPGLAVLTHMSHQFDYDTLMGETPENVMPGIDGMELDVETAGVAGSGVRIYLP